MANLHRTVFGGSGMMKVSYVSPSSPQPDSHWRSRIFHKGFSIGEHPIPFCSSMPPRERSGTHLVPEASASESVLSGGVTIFGGLSTYRHEGKAAAIFSPNTARRGWDDAGELQGTFPSPPDSHRWSRISCKGFPIGKHSVLFC